ncbi:hypothetical protein [Streptomyces sp. TRM68416]|uniref:hypothetical protein n=1 Tax=Streptomyces sp. TRM68416 TaxID=2758412 RepID=UPI001661B15C|nr:hypothetical protein [Streptomyces sp. TRM68416]MBD0840719.1 hypothetical protein [Streptomyces sp. TRM68416]
MPLHAIEIILTRTVRGVELKVARRISGMPMASSHDGKSIAVLVSARDEELAIRKVWRRLQDSLPIDVLCTLFPGPDGILRMSIPFTYGVKRRIRSWARAAGKSPEEFLSTAVKEALARDRSTDAASQDCALNFLLHSCTWLDLPLEITDRLAVSRLPLPLENLVRRISTSGSRLAITGDAGPIATLVSEQELKRLDDLLAITEGERGERDNVSGARGHKSTPEKCAGESPHVEEPP